MNETDIRMAEDERPSQIMNLPPEILRAIFIRLDVKSKCRAAQVSRTWREMAYQQAVWQDVVVPLRLNGKCTNVMLTSLQNRRVRNVKILSFDKRGERLRVLFRHLTCLRSLDFGGCVNFTNSALQHGMNGPPVNLTELQLTWSLITNRCIYEITRRCVNLRQLNLRWCGRLTDDALVHVGNHLPELTALDMEGCLITGAGVSHLIGSPVSRGNRKLECLGLQYCEIGSNDLRNIAENLPSLRCLKLENMREVTGDALSRLAMMDSLRELKLASSDLNDGLLASLSLSRITALDLGSNGSLSGVGLSHLAEMRNLRSLVVKYCSVDDGGLQHLARSGSRIVMLNLKGNDRVTDAGLEHLTKLVDLRSVNLSYCPAITTAGLLALAEGARQIVNIKIYGYLMNRALDLYRLTRRIVRSPERENFSDLLRLFRLGYEATPSLL